MPHGTLPSGFFGLWHIFISYILSYMMVAIYWVNHHHLFRGVKRVDSALLWANIFWLFFLSMVPFFTAYMGENKLTPFSVTLYLVELLACAVSYAVLQAVAHRDVCQIPERAGMARMAMVKNMVAICLYAVGALFAGWGDMPAPALAAAFVVSLMYFIPTAWIEKRA